MKVLVTGGAGYIGSTLIPALLDHGCKVRCLDRLFFGREALDGVSSDPRFELVKDDIRWFDPSILEGLDAVIDLAALSNDPSGELDPAKTLDINYAGRRRVAKLSKEYGVKRYLIASSCSVYGFQEGLMEETCPTNPLTTYARANVMLERDVLPLSDSGFAVAALRFATVYGLSGRMRFDLAINGMVLSLYKTGKIRTMRDGTQWRPFVHVSDVANAVIDVLDASPDKVAAQVFNVGSNEENYQIGQLATIIGNSVGLPFEIEWYGSPDRRSYRVSFDKIKSKLNYAPRHTAREGAKEVYSALKDGRVSDTLKTRTVEWYKYLMDAHAVSKEVVLRDTVL